MFQNPLTGTLNKVTKFIKSIEEGIEINDAKCQEKERELQAIKSEISGIEKETQYGKLILEKLKS